MISAAAWAEWLEHRRQIKRPMTPLAERRMLARLERYAAEGIDVERALGQSIERGWRGCLEPGWPVEEFRKAPEPEKLAELPPFAHKNRAKLKGLIDSIDRAWKHVGRCEDDLERQKRRALGAEVRRLAE